MTAFQGRTAAFRVPAARPAWQPSQPALRPGADLDLAWLEPDGTIRRDTRALPDIPLVVAAVSSFARGTLLPGRRGDIAVEDLMPGDCLRVRGGWRRVVWTCAQTHAPTAGAVLYRVAAGAFGACGPVQDVLLAAQARILVETRRCPGPTGGQLAFAPLAAFEDGHAVTALSPPGEVTVYGIACDAQEAVPVAGLAVETCHPTRAVGEDHGDTMARNWTRLLPPFRDGAGFPVPGIPSLTFTQAQDLAIAGF